MDINEERYLCVSVSAYKICAAPLPGECDSVTLLQNHIMNFQTPKACGN